MNAWKLYCVCNVQHIKYYLPETYKIIVHEQLLCPLVVKGERLTCKQVWCHILLPREILIFQITPSRYSRCFISYTGCPAKSNTVISIAIYFFGFEVYQEIGIEVFKIFFLQVLHSHFNTGKGILKPYFKMKINSLYVRTSMFVHN